MSDPAPAVPADHSLNQAEARTENSEPVLRNMDLALLSWLILFGFGGGLFALYYSSIGYIPDIKWEDSVVYVGALTIAGAFLFILYFLLLFIPGWMWSEFLIFDERLRCILCKEERKGFFTPRRMRVLVNVGVPFALFQFCVHVFLEEQLASVGLALAVGSVLVLSSFLMIWLVLKNPGGSVTPTQGTSAQIILVNPESGEKKQEEGSSKLKNYYERLYLENAMFFAVSSLASFFSILLFRWSFGPDSKSPMYLVCTVTVTAVNLFVAFSCKKMFKASVIVMAAAALGLLVLGDVLVQQKEARLSARIMSRFGIGFNRTATVLLTDDGAAILKKYELIEKDAEPKVECVEILSRLGSEYFLRSQIKGRSFSLPKTSVLSWSFEEPRPPKCSTPVPQTVPAVEAKAALSTPMQATN